MSYVCKNCKKDITAEAKDEPRQFSTEKPKYLIVKCPHCQTWNKFRRPK